MKKNNSLRELLGITQDDMAMLLGVSRSRLAMFELGKRDLPVNAMVLLADMLQYAQNQKKNAEVLPEVAQQKIEMQQDFERLLKENEYQQLLFSKKIATAQRNFDRHSAILHSTTFLKSAQHDKSAQHSTLVEHIATKASKGIAENNLSLQTGYEMRLELLQLEKMLILNSLRKNTSSPQK